MQGSHSKAMNQGQGKWDPNPCSTERRFGNSGTPEGKGYLEELAAALDFPVPTSNPAAPSTIYMDTLRQKEPGALFLT